MTALSGKCYYCSPSFNSLIDKNKLSRSSFSALMSVKCNLFVTLLLKQINRCLTIHIHYSVSRALVNVNGCSFFCIQDFSDAPLLSCQMPFCQTAVQLLSGSRKKQTKKIGYCWEQLISTSNVVWFSLFHSISTTLGLFNAKFFIHLQIFMIVTIFSMFHLHFWKITLLFMQKKMIIYIVVISSIFNTNNLHSYMVSSIPI